METGEEITTKNIIITMCDNYTLNDRTITMLESKNENRKIKYYVRRN